MHAKITGVQAVPNPHITPTGKNGVTPLGVIPRRVTEARPLKYVPVGGGDIGSFGTSPVTVPPDKQTVKQDRRVNRRKMSYKLRKVLKGVTTSKSLKACGEPKPQFSTVGVRLTGQPGQPGTHAGFSGVMRCASVWSCPVCSPKIHFHRQSELMSALTYNQQQGGSAAMITLTMRHNSDSLKDDNGQQLSNLWAALSKAWSRIIGGKVWEDVSSISGLSGIARYVELTHGRNGWHIHLHCVAFFDNPCPTKKAVARLTSHMFNRWSNSLVSSGLEKPTRSRAVDFRMLTGSPVVQDDPSEYATTDPDTGEITLHNPEMTYAEIINYLTKQADQSLTALYALERIEAALKSKNGKNSDLERNTRGLAAEATGWAGTKQAKGNNRTPWQILSDYLETGSPVDLGLWQEYERASKGRRFSVWSGRKTKTPEHRWNQILDARGEIMTDEAIMENTENKGETIAEISSDVWRDLNRLNSFSQADLLTAAEQSGLPGVLAYLAQFNVFLE